MLRLSNLAAVIAAVVAYGPRPPPRPPFRSVPPNLCPGNSIGWP